MKRPLRHKLAMALALGATGGLGGCSMHAGYGGHGGYGGYTRASGYTSRCSTGYYRVSGGTEAFLIYAGFYAGVTLVAGMIELLDECLEVKAKS